MSIRLRKTIIIVFLVSGFFLYFGPGVFRWLFASSSYPPGNIEMNINDWLRRQLTSLVSLVEPGDLIGRCITDRVSRLLPEARDYDANMAFSPPREDYENSLEVVRFIGNGYVGLEIDARSPVYIKTTAKVLSVPVPFYPVATVSTQEAEESEPVESVSVLSYVGGLAHRIECIPLKSGGSLQVEHEFYAHQVIPSL